MKVDSDSMVDKLVTLDVGCGESKENHAIGIDQFQLEGVDIVCDLNLPWPLRDSSFDKVIFRHSIIHLNNLGFALSEAERVCRVNGVIEIISPHFSSDNIFTDPTVKFFTGYRTMDYYCVNTDSKYKYYSSSRLWLESRRIYVYKSSPKNSFQRLIAYVVYPFEFLINSFPRAYEKFFCFVFRGNEIVYVLRVQ